MIRQGLAYFPWIRVAFAFIALLGAPCGGRADVVYFDNTFSDTSWGPGPAAVYGNDPAHRAFSDFLPTGGNPGSFRRVRTMRADSGVVYSFNMNAAATYNAVVSGNVASIDYWEDSKNFLNTPGSGQGTGLAVYQNGKYYRQIYSITITDTGNPNWTSGSEMGITEARLVEVMPTGVTIPSSHPDFSASGSPMTFGYCRVSASDFPSATECGIDNWRINIINPVIVTPAAAQSCTCCGGRPAFVDRLPATPFGSGVVSVTSEEGDGPTAPVVRVWNLTPPFPAFPSGGLIANPPTYSHPSWSQTNLGSVFGVCFGRDGDIFAAATSVYAQDNVGTLGGNIGGKIYKINGTTGVASLFCALPNTLVASTTCFNPNVGTQIHPAYPGIGQVAFDCANNVLFASNFEDGRIYRISSAGVILSTFDHAGTGNGPAIILPGTPPADPPGFAPLNQNPAQRGQRVWAVQPGRGKLYYSVWREDVGYYANNIGHPSSQVNNEIWSVLLSPGGDFVAGTEQLEISMPQHPSFAGTCVPSTANTLYAGNGSNPVASIELRPGCNCLLLAERTMVGEGCTDAHVSRVLEFCDDLGSLIPSLRTFAVPGTTFINNGPSSAAGGVAFDWTPGARNAVWATSDLIRAPQGPCVSLTGYPYVYGMIGISPNGSTTGFNDVHIDFNGSPTQTKFTLGSVDVSCPGCSAPPSTMNLWLPLDEPSGTAASNTAMAAFGGSYVGTANLTSVLGPVGRGQCFDRRSYIQVPDYAGINPGVGSFSIDLWMKNDLAATGNVGILDKRNGYTAAGSGYALSINNNSYPVLSIRDTAGKQYIAQGGGVNALPVGVWEHIAFTVTRSGSAIPVVECYRNGVPVSVTPLTSTPAPWGSLNGSGSVPLRIGSPLVPGNPGSAWTGCMDEIEFFTRALTASEVQNIAWRNKCKSGTYAPINKPVCSGQTTITTPVQVCNYSGASAIYGYTFGPKPGCGTTVSPAGYTPPSGNITVASGFCGTINVTMPTPLFVTTGNISCFELCATPQGVSSPMTTCTTGTLQLTSSVFCRPPPIPLSVSTRVAQPVTIPLTNNSDQPVSGVFRISVLGPDGQPDLSMISLDDLSGQGPQSPGVQLSDPFTDFPVHVTGTVEFGVTFWGQDPIGVYTIVVEVDLDGDGVFDPVTSVELRNTPPGAFCPADFNHSGAVTVQDIFDFLMDYFGMNLAADFNNSGTITVQDIFDFLGAYFTACP